MCLLPENLDDAEIWRACLQGWVEGADTESWIRQFISRLVPTFGHSWLICASSNTFFLCVLSLMLSEKYISSCRLFKVDCWPAQGSGSSAHFDHLVAFFSSQCWTTDQSRLSFLNLFESFDMNWRVIWFWWPKQVVKCQRRVKGEMCRAWPQQIWPKSWASGLDFSVTSHLHSNQSGFPGSLSPKQLPCFSLFLFILDWFWL